MVGAFNNNLMGPDAIHFVIDSDPFLVEISFYDQRRIFIGHHSEFPPWGIIGLGRVAPIDEDFCWSCIFIAGTERAESSLNNLFLNDKVCRTSAALLGNNYPATEDGILA